MDECEFGRYYGLTVSPKSSMLKIKSSNSYVGGGAFGKSLGLVEVMRVEPSGLVALYEEEERRELIVPVLLPCDALFSCYDTARSCGTLTLVPPTCRTMK